MPTDGADISVGKATALRPKLAAVNEDVAAAGKHKDTDAEWLPGVSQKRNLHSNGYLVPGILQVTMHLTLCCALPQCSNQDICH